MESRLQSSWRGHLLEAFPRSLKTMRSPSRRWRRVGALSWSEMLRMTSLVLCWRVHASSPACPVLTVSRLLVIYENVFLEIFSCHSIDLHIYTSQTRYILLLTSSSRAFNLSMSGFCCGQPICKPCCSSGFGMMWKWTWPTS